MNQALTTIFLGFALLLSGTSAMAATEIPLDPHHTSASFHVKHLTITTVTGEIPLTSSYLTIKPDGIPSSAHATFDLTKIETQDDLRDKDLRGDKWFDTASYPAMTFKSTMITAGVGKTFTVQGLLSMHGQTHPVTLLGIYSGHAKDPMGKIHYGYSLTGTLDRTVWGIGNAPDVLVGKDIAIDIEAEAIQ